MSPPKKWIVFVAIKDLAPLPGQPLLVRGEGMGGKHVYAIAKLKPNGVTHGWEEHRFLQRSDSGDSGTTLWFTPTAWAPLDNPDLR